MNRYIVLFILFSFMGWIWESIYCTISRKKWANRGFLYGPVCPIYGFGGMIGLAVYDLTAKSVLPEMSWWMIFLAGFIISMVLEYPTSWLLEKCFHARWWDYSKVPLNIDGRTSVPTSVAFGGAAIAVMKVILPFFVFLLNKMPGLLIDFFAFPAVAIVSADITLTVSALTDFQKRIAAIDESIQKNMTENVYHLIKTSNKLYTKAIDRIAYFKRPAKRNKIEREKFEILIAELKESPKVEEMNRYIQHGNTTTLEHCENVAWISYMINKKLHVNANEKELIEAAMLHDFYLYDWHDGEPERKTHGFDHPEIAKNNAEKYFNVSDNVKKAIRSHMWPLNITIIPKSREAVLLCLVDKYCAIIETFRMKKK